MIKRADGRWQERIVIDGKTKYVYGKNKSDVKRKCDALLQKIEKSYGFSSVAEAWKEEHFPTLVPSTQLGYTAAYKRAVEHFGDKEIDTITPQDIATYLDLVRGRGLTTKTIMTYKLVLILIFRYAVNNRLASTDPSQFIKTPKGKESKPREIPTDEEIEKVKAGDWLLPIFILYTGCRKGEALALTYEDIDRNAKRIVINKSVGFSHNRPFLKTPKTANAIRTVPLLDGLAERLSHGTGLIFSHNEKLYDEASFRRAWDEWQARNDVNVTPHQLRHAYATICHDAGLDAKDAMSLLGHADISTTMNIYTHIDKQRQTAIADKLNAFMGK